MLELELNNQMELKFAAKSANEAFARATVAAFAAQLNPTLAEIMEIKTAVSEAVTNAIIHGYDNNFSENCNVTIKCSLTANINQKEISIEIHDDGKGIDNIEKAREPLYTSKPELERSGMGFSVMEEFMDNCDIVSQLGKGTVIKMLKRIG